MVPLFERLEEVNEDYLEAYEFSYYFLAEKPLFYRPRVMALLYLTGNMRAYRALKYYKFLNK